MICRCEQCLVEFETTKKNAKYCTRSCLYAALRILKSKKRYPKKCIGCNEFYNHTPKTYGKKYCSLKCKEQTRRLKWLNAWKAGEKLGYCGAVQGISVVIRRYLFEKYNNKCCKCGWAEIHPVTGNIPLEINHIDGIASNCSESNLELICPNCHSLTPNFRSLNKVSSRRKSKNGPSAEIRTQT